MVPPEEREALGHWGPVFDENWTPTDAEQPTDFEAAVLAMRELVKSYPQPSTEAVPIPEGTPMEHPIELAHMIRAQASVANRTAVIEYHFDEAELTARGLNFGMLMFCFRGKSYTCPYKKPDLRFRDKVVHYDVEVDDDDKEEEEDEDEENNNADYAVLRRADDLEAVERVKADMMERAPRLGRAQA